MLGDGELGEGSVWEAVAFSKAKQLSNLVFLVDKNNFQQTGETSEISGFMDIEKIFKGFGLNVHTVNGHDFNKIDIILSLKDSSNSPRAVIFETIKGSGFNNMQNNNNFHHILISEKQFEEYMNECT